MATKVHMEALSPTMEEGQLVRWLKKEGEQVAEGDVLAEIETDKATMELVARGSGVLQNVSLKEGETAPVGQVIAVIGAEGEQAEGEADARKPEAEAEAEGEGEGETETDAEAQPEPGSEPETGGAGAGAGAGQRAETEKAEKAPKAAKGEERPRAEAGRTGQPAPQGDDGRVKASPLARKLADEAGLELSRVSGSGPGGRITKKDIEAALESGAAAASAPAGARGGVQRGGPEYEDVPVSQMRKAIAKRLVQSIGPVPTFYLTIEVDMSRIMEARERVNARLADDGIKTSINDFLIKALAAALVRHPEVNAQWHDTHVRRFNRAHVGVAVAIEDGLITPVVRDADAKSISEIAVEVKELATRARAKKLKPEEYTGATFSISNLGMFGIHEFTAIINPPEAGILAIGRTEDRITMDEDGDLVVEPRMRITMSCDHRVIDGASGAKFLQTLQGLIEEPVMMLA